MPPRIGNLAELSAGVFRLRARNLLEASSRLFGFLFCCRCFCSNFLSDLVVRRAARSSRTVTMMEKRMRNSRWPLARSLPIPPALVENDQRVQAATDLSRETCVPFDASFAGTERTTRPCPGSQADTIRRTADGEASVFCALFTFERCITGATGSYDPGVNGCDVNVIPNIYGPQRRTRTACTIRSTCSRTTTSQTSASTSAPRDRKSASARSNFLLIRCANGHSRSTPRELTS